MSEDSRIREIREVLVGFGQLGEPGRQNQTTALEALEKIDDILGRSVRTLITTGPRTDAVGTVRQHVNGTRAVKVSDTVGDAVVWCSVSALLGVGWFAHEDVANDDWSIVVPALPVSEIEWGWRSRRNPGLVMAPLAKEVARRSASGPADVELIQREVGPWKVVQS